MWDAGCAKRGSIKGVFILNNNKNYTNSLKKKIYILTRFFEEIILTRLKLEENIIKL